MSQPTSTKPSGSGLVQTKTVPASLTTHIRWSIYLLLITIATGAMLGRTMAVDSVDVRGLENYLKSKNHPEWKKSRPVLSANDRSRWDTVRSLVEHGTYAIDDVIQEPGWDTIDMVKHVGPDGQEHLYSSKPPLLATLMAGPYWLVYHLTGATLSTHPYEIIRPMLVLWNVIPLVIYFLIVAKLVERLGTTDWGRIFVMAAATFGTFLTTYVVTINNHLPGAVCAAVALWAFVRIVYDNNRELRWFALAGFFAALTAACELPALAFLCLLALPLLIRTPRQTLLAFLPAALVVVAAHFGTNYLAHGTLREPYSHWDDWYFFSYEVRGKTVESYWTNPKGIDRGEESRNLYALHTLIGHHGIFSLTPIWLLSVAGLGMWMARRDRRELALGILLLSVVVVAFYISNPMAQRTYGGMTSGLRWMFWFAPLWLAAMLPATDWCAQVRWRRGLALALLCLSVLSVSYPTWNPWTHPWIMNFMMYQGWVTL